MLQNLTPTVRNLILINVAIFVLSGLIIPQEYLTLHYYESPDFQFYQLVTYLFVHANFMHLLGNMFGLFMFGSLLERIWGAQRFLFFYFFCGIGAGLLYMGIQYYIDYADIRRATDLVLSDPNSATLLDYWQHYGAINAPNGLVNIDLIKQNYLQIVSTGVLGGASGSVFGILMAFGYLFPNSEMFLFPIPIPIKAKYFVSGYGLYELYAGMQQNPGDNVAHFAHLGGMFFAIILIFAWKTNRNNFY
ncbi:rhomboid family intramembrane serine protease [Aquirufa sp. ROCK2-A2]